MTEKAHSVILHFSHVAKSWKKVKKAPYFELFGFPEDISSLNVLRPAFLSQKIGEQQIKHIFCYQTTPSNICEHRILLIKGISETFWE